MTEWICSTRALYSEEEEFHVTRYERKSKHLFTHGLKIEGVQFAYHAYFYYLLFTHFFPNLIQKPVKYKFAE